MAGLMKEKKTKGETVAYLTLSSTQLDGWSKMNVKYTKAPFTKKTICSQFYYLGQELGCHREMLFDGTCKEDKVICLKYSERFFTPEKHLLLKKVENHDNKNS